MEMKKIYDGDQVCAIHIMSKNAFDSGLNFFSSDSDFIQAGTWKYESGKKLLPHFHNIVLREVSLTQEVLYIKSGAIKASVYGIKKNLISEFLVEAGDILIMLRGGHGYEILKDDTEVLEVKNGPYLGAEIDRTRI